MSKKASFSIPAHPDIELGWKREQLDVFLELPKAMNEDTGLIVFVDGWGGLADSEYQTEKLRPYFADKFNCIVAGVNYFGIHRDNNVILQPAFFHNINRIYGLNMSPDSFKESHSDLETYSIIINKILERGCSCLDIRCQPTFITGKGEYQSWGFLPAIDNLCMVGEILQRYPINRRKIVIYGSSYGGYIALLMGKYAPRSFSAIIDKAGFSRTLLKHVAGGEIHEADYLIRFPIDNYSYPFTIHCGFNNPWTVEDETSRSYFSDSHRKIRTLLEEEHRVKSECRYYIFHSQEDDTSPIEDKDQCVEILRRYNEVYYKRVGLEDMGGGLFNNLKHDLGVSTRELFDHVAELERDSFLKKDTDTDFNLNSTYRFKCAAHDYIFNFSPSNTIRVRIEKR